jgi:hypothetical protein
VPSEGCSILKSSRYNIVDGRVVPSDVVRGDAETCRNYHT